MSHNRDTARQRHAGLIGALSLGIAAHQSLAFVMLRRFAFSGVLSLWWYDGAFSLRHPWPFEYWCGVITSNVSEGLFRGKMNLEVIDDRLECSEFASSEIQETAGLVPETGTAGVSDK